MLSGEKKIDIETNDWSVKKIESKIYFYDVKIPTDRIFSL